jgi:uncharacterized protein (TIGR02246 family)
MMAIEQLVSRYNMAIDDGDGDDYAATFSDDGELVLPDTTIAGREALIVFGGAAKERQVQTRHWVSSQVVTVTGDEATVRSNLMVLRVGGDGPAVLLTGRYADELRRTDTGWRFTRRVFTPDNPIAPIE